VFGAVRQNKKVCIDKLNGEGKKNGRLDSNRKRSSFGKEICNEKNLGNAPGIVKRLESKFLFFIIDLASFGAMGSII